MVEQIEQVALHEATQVRYLNYALSVITSRALPDVRDGLKPVQRRILYAMHHNLHLSHDAKHRKSAAVVGEVMAKYHPHGDQSIYDAMVRMAQPFSLRYPLVNGQGNFGSLDGDSAAAMRYTEVKLRALSGELLIELNKKTVNLRPNYDGQNFEPEVLPARLPNMLLNGAMGIAVGMATSIPPHNLREVLKACIYMLDHPDATVATLMKYIRGPDFPTGGKLLNTPEELLTIYEEGSGSLKVAGECEVEGEGKNKRLIIKSIPYVVNKATLIEKIAEHIRSGNIPQLVDVRDESTEEIRIVLEMLPNTDHRLVEAYLCKHTPLQSRFSVNMTCLVPSEVEGGALQPMRMGLDEMLGHFLHFRKLTLKKRLTFDLELLERRIHLLEAFEKIFADLDEVIRIVRQSDSKKEAALALMERFELDEVQAEAVLETKLYRLSKMEISQVRKELKERRASADALRTLLADEGALRELLKQEMSQLRKDYGDKRRTSLEGPGEEIEINAEDFIVREDTIVIVTRGGWIKRQRSYSDLSTIRVRENDELGWVIHTQTHQTVTLFTNHGKAYTLLADNIPSTSGYGDPIQASFDFSDGEKVVGVVANNPSCEPREVPNWFMTPEADPINPADLPIHLVAVTRCGNGVRFPLDPYISTSTRSGRGYVRLLDKAPDGEMDGVVAVIPSNGSENLCLATHKGRALICRAADISEVKGRSRGVRVIKLAKGDAVMAICLSIHRLQGLEVITNRDRHEIIRTTKYPVTKRGNLGRPILLRGFLAGAVRETTVFLPPSIEEVEEKEKPLVTPTEESTETPPDAVATAPEDETPVTTTGAEETAPEAPTRPSAKDRLGAAIRRGAILVDDLKFEDEDEEQMSLW